MLFVAIADFKNYHLLKFKHIKVDFKKVIKTKLLYCRVNKFWKNDQCNCQKEFSIGSGKSS